MILTITANPAIDKVYFVDEFVMGNVYRPHKLTVSAGGKGLNVSRVARILGEEVTAMGFLGGSSGNYIQNEISKLGILTNFTPISGETRTCINISDRLGCSGELLEEGPTITEIEKDAFFTQFNSTINACDIVCISGSLAKGLDSSFYSKLIKLCNIKNIPVIIDTSGATLSKIIDENPFMVKPNCDEAQQLTGIYPKTTNDVKTFLRFLKEKGVTVPFVSLGKNGSATLINDKYYHFKIPSVTVVNSVGSGDSTVAGIAVGICRNLPIIDAIRLGMASGIANTQFQQTGLVTTDLVEKFYKQIDVVEL